MIKLISKCIMSIIRNLIYKYNHNPFKPSIIYIILAVLLIIPMICTNSIPIIVVLIVSIIGLITSAVNTYTTKIKELTEYKINKDKELTEYKIKFMDKRIEIFNAFCDYLEWYKNSYYDGEHCFMELYNFDKIKIQLNLDTTEKIKIFWETHNNYKNAKLQAIIKLGTSFIAYFNEDDSKYLEELYNFGITLEELVIDKINQNQNISIIINRISDEFQGG